MRRWGHSGRRRARDLGYHRRTVRGDGPWGPRAPPRTLKGVADASYCVGILLAELVRRGCWCCREGERTTLVKMQVAMWAKVPRLEQGMEKLASLDRDTLWSVIAMVKLSAEELCKQSWSNECLLCNGLHTTTRLDLPVSGALPLN